MADRIKSGAAIPPDDVTKRLTVANPDDPKMRHISVAGGTYTILVSGEETGDRYCLVDMLVPPGGGPPPHRHDFEEMFTILDGEIELNFRGATRAPLVQEQVRQAGTPTLHVHASWAGGVLHGGWRSGR
jgi:mannose-6-phosphate isomerase-like protein (cupin superfamily)